MKGFPLGHPRVLTAGWQLGTPVGTSEDCLGRLILGSGGEAQAVPWEGKPAEKVRMCPQSGSPVRSVGVIREDMHRGACHPGAGAGSMEDLEALTSTAALSHGVGGEAWRLREGMVISKCLAQVGTGVRQPQDIVGSGGRTLSSPPFSFLPLLSPLLPPSFLSFS